MTTHRERALGQARADLTALPDLCDELARCLTERGHPLGKQGKISGSPALIRLDVFHLLDPRRKDGWELEDPRYRNLTDWLGVAPLLESWVRVVWEEHSELVELTETATVRSECAVLLEHWVFVESNRWADELAKDVSAVTDLVRAALGIRKAQRYRCPKCNNPAYLVPGGILSCEEGHDRVVRDLEKQLRRRPPMSTKDVCAEFAEFGVTEAQLWQWKHRRRIAPTKDDHGKLWWLPWDVFCLLNPDIAEAVDLRDQAEAEQTEPA